MTFRELLKSKGYTVKSFSEEMGISKDGIYRWLSGAFKPGLKNCRKISEILGISMEELMDVFEDKEEDIHPFKKLLKSRRKTISSFSRELGVNESSVYYWMSGERNPSKKHLHEMKIILRVNIGELKKIFKNSSKLLNKEKNNVR